MVDYGVTTREKITRVSIRKITGVKHKEWAFIEMPSEQEVEASFRRRFRLKDSSIYLQRDLSWEERARLKKQRENQTRPDRRYLPQSSAHSSGWDADQQSGMFGYPAGGLQQSSQDPNGQQADWNPSNPYPRRRGSM